MARIKAAIIGSGNIGTDLMMKMIKYPQNMELVAVVGIDPASEGLAMARERGIATTHDGIEGLKKLPCYAEIGIAFSGIRQTFTEIGQQEHFAATGRCRRGSWRNTDRHLRVHRC